LGYLVGAEPFIREARALRASILRHPPGHIQRTAAYFLSLGHYDALIKRTARQFQTRRTLMQDAITEFGLTIAGTPPKGGSSFWMQAPKHINTVELARKLEPHGVLIEPARSFFSGNAIPNHFYRLAFSSISDGRIRDGIRIISDVISEIGPKS